MLCEICNSEMRPLFTSNYCPNEDKHNLIKENRKKELAIYGTDIREIIEANSVKIPFTKVEFPGIAAPERKSFLKCKQQVEKSTVTAARMLEECLNRRFRVLFQVHDEVILEGFPKMSISDNVLWKEISEIWSLYLNSFIREARESHKKITYKRVAPAESDSSCGTANPKSELATVDPNQKGIPNMGLGFVTSLGRNGRL